VQSPRDDFRVVVIGAGMAGILAGIKLEEAGFTNVTIYEKAAQIGGTWRENTYPGIACDVPSHLYCYSFEPNAQWSHLFSPGDEIQRYFERVATDHRLLERIRLNEEVTEAAFDNGRWHLGTSKGNQDVADVVIAATGVLHHPNIPVLEGIETFQGSTFHSARWDHTIDLADKRIGVVGTGSTAIQITAALVDHVAQYSLFQRTAQWVIPAANRPYSPEEIAAFQADPQIVIEQRKHLARFFEEGFANAVVEADSAELKAIEEVCRQNLETVRDLELRERLRPDYRAACKRLIISAEFYEAIQKPNAHLVTAGIERVEADGVRTLDGTLHPLDVLVLATGFRVDRFMRPMHIVGRGGVTLAKAWAQRPTAYLSVSIPEFPNLFMLNGPNGPVGNFSLVDVAEIQMRYLLTLIERLASGQCQEISASAQATERYEAERVEAAKHTVWSTGCKSWYLDDRGVPAAWPWPFHRFREVMATPDLDAFELVTS
jgi:cation diffusion facilitator CzcD-associated flavoprotein CzcO